MKSVIDFFVFQAHYLSSQTLYLTLCRILHLLLNIYSYAVLMFLWLKFRNETQDIQL